MVEEFLQRLSLILSYVKEIIRDRWGSPIRDVLCPEQFCKLWELRHMAIKEADEPVNRCSHQGAHEQLASHRIGGPNQHHLHMKSREMGLRVLRTSEGNFGPYKCGWYGITASMISCENGIRNSLGGVAGS